MSFFSKKDFINILIFSITMITLFCAGEVFIRFYLPEPENKGQLARKEWNRDYKKSVFIPNTEVIDSGIPTKINSMGLKNKEIALYKRENTLRISIFGDSFTYGQGLSLDETYQINWKEN